MTQSGHWGRKVLGFSYCTKRGPHGGAHAAAQIHHSSRRCGCRMASQSARAICGKTCNRIFEANIARRFGPNQRASRISGRTEKLAGSLSPCGGLSVMSASPPKAEIRRHILNVRFVPKANIKRQKVKVRGDVATAICCHYKSQPFAFASANTHNVPVGWRRPAGRLSSSRRSRLNIARFSSPATKKAACRLLSSTG
jgi:hypothetical protein